MNKKKPWLTLAARAQHYKTVDKQHAVRRTVSELETASTQHESLQHELQRVAGLWLQRRQNSQVDAATEAAFCRFHAHLHWGTEDALHAKKEAQRHLELATDQLKHSFGSQKVLQHFVTRVEQQQSRARQAQEQQLTGEAWLLRRKGQETSGDEP